MNTMHVKHALVSIVLAAGIAGVALLGLAFGHSLRIGDLSAVNRHPLFATGVECVTSSIVCVLLSLGIGGQKRRR